MSKSKSGADLATRADAINPPKPSTVDEVYACVYLHDHDAGDVADVLGLDKVYDRVVMALDKVRGA